jgi:selenocysteine lyase/cysteine desulfurase
MKPEIRELFPATKYYTYLDSAAVAPLPVMSVTAVQSQLTNVMNNGSIGFFSWIETKNRARALAAAMLGVRDEQVAFVRNTSDAISTIANGINWRAGDNIVTFAGEFPSNFHPWRRIRDKYGAELRLCPERDNRIDLGELTRMIDANTRVVAISAVQYASGFCADLRRIGENARNVGALFVVDMIQAFGVLPLDLEFVDAAAGASHKWLCSPEGCGILYLSDRAREMVEPTLAGWQSFDSADSFANGDDPFKPNALAWETGTGPSALFYGMEQSLKLLCGLGAQNIAAYLNSLTEHLCELLSGSNYEILSSRRPRESSQIVSISHRGSRAPLEIFRHLKECKIITSPRGAGLRVAPHVFNNFEDIENLVRSLPDRI